MSSGFGLDKGGIGGAITTLGNIIVNVFTPIINGLLKAFGYVKNAIGDNLDTFKEFGGYIAQYLAPVIGTVLGGALQVVGKIAGGVIDVIAGVIKAINFLIGGAIDGINALIRAYNAVPLLPNIPTINKPTLNTPSISSASVSAPSIPSTPSMSMPSVSGASSGAAAASASAARAQALVPTVTIGGAPAGYRPETFTPTATLGGAPASYVTNNVNIGVAGDPEGVARAVVDVINTSYYRGGLGAQAYKL
jgi:hypothetical protein